MPLSPWAASRSVGRCGARFVPSRAHDLAPGSRPDRRTAGTANRRKDDAPLHRGPPPTAWPSVRPRGRRASGEPELASGPVPAPRSTGHRQRLAGPTRPTAEKRSRRPAIGEGSPRRRVRRADHRFQFRRFGRPDVSPGVPLRARPGARACVPPPRPADPIGRPPGHPEAAPGPSAGRHWPSPRRWSGGRAPGCHPGGLDACAAQPHQDRGPRERRRAPAAM